jgi:polyhydroxyalkanoate synthase subunit PhaE
MSTQPWNEMAKRWTDTFQRTATLVQNEWLDGQKRLATGLAGATNSDPSAGAAALADFWRSWMSLGAFWASPAYGHTGNLSRAEIPGVLPNSVSLPLTSGSQVSQMLRRITEGPRLADVGAPERLMAKIIDHWIAVQESARIYEGVVASAWAEANSRFVEDISQHSRSAKDALDTQEALRRWLDIANQVLLQTQRSEKFLAAQRQLLRDGMNFMLIQREFVEWLVEPAGLPTRSEMDEVHHSIHQLKRRLRALEKAAAAQPIQPVQPPPSPRAATKTTEGRARTQGGQG